MKRLSVRHWYYCGWILLLWGATVFAQSMEMLRARHRPAQELVEVLRPLLGPGESISAYQYQIILRASPATVTNVRRILEQIDQPAKQYVVQWQITGQEQANRDALNGAVVLNSDGRTVGGQAGGTVLSTQNNRRDNFSQQVRVMEGGSAWITLNQQVPLQVRQTTITPYGVVSSTGSQYVSFNSGLAVSPRQIGNSQQVQLALSPQRSQVNNAPNYGLNQGYPNAGAQVTQLSTTITVNLGEWVEIGSMDEQADSSRRGILSSNEARRQRGQRLLVKVDLVP
ncbi:secretin N-terminal domain-containing protein [Parvibium lacunae]|nr:secretin N-terminal domain-containing protein [Parvibium lacunae]